MSSHRIVVVGGGAAGMFAAITAAEADPKAEVRVLEQGPHWLSKVRISGGGRCNVTHACFDPKDLSSYYPRGGSALIGPFRRFQPSDTVAWFEKRGVTLKTEPDGRMFPVTDSSETIVECLLQAARRAGVRMQLQCGVEQVQSAAGGGFVITTSRGDRMACDKMLLATGGCRAAAAGRLATSLGHTLEPPVPSLFTFCIEAPWLQKLAGVSVEDTAVSVRDTDLESSGALLITHWGVSGPAVLKLSAWGARRLHAISYRFALQVDWLPSASEDMLRAQLQERRQVHGARAVSRDPLTPIPARLWEQLVLQAGMTLETRWSSVTRTQQHQLLQQLKRLTLSVSGKSLNRDEFVTCGGVRLAEVNFKTMESRLQSGLHFAGELLDIDGLTGGFNFQAAWTTGWIAGHAMATHGPG